ncbi:MAG: biosynthesis transferase [Chloroflexi bacterium]|jgi:hypothetical protein|nr:biosynthesis transferase [Chloroflexota bacterium]
MRRLRILTWQVHGSYMYYLLHAPHDFYLAVGKDNSGSRGQNTHWPDNTTDVPEKQIKDLEFDLILFQTRQNYEVDQYEFLSEKQRRLPRIYLEHDPPRQAPTDTRHWVDDPEVLLVHCTHFNNLMWDNNRTPSRVIEHGVTIPEGVRYSGELEKGIVVINGLKQRGRRLGTDIFEQARREIPLDLLGIDWQASNGLGEIPLPDLPAFEARYRFFFNPIRYTSLGLAVLEAMLTGLPVVGLATTEMVMVIQNGVNGYIDTNPAVLTERMRELLDDPAQARKLGEGARQTVLDRFNIQRFARDWDETFRMVAG